MNITYRPLWKLLNKRGLTKTQMREMSGLNTVTLAKMSKDQPVSTGVIEAICKALNCELSDVMELAQTDPLQSWSRIKRPSFYWINLFFMQNPEQPEQKGSLDYVYGFAALADDGVKRHSTWHLEPEKIPDPAEKTEMTGSGRIFRLTNIVTGEELCDLLRSMEQGAAFQNYLQDNSFELRIEKPAKKSCDKELFLSQPVSRRKFLYRPMIYLESESVSSGQMEDLQPHHSPGRNSMYCESLVCADKRSLYRTKSGEMDIGRMELLYQFFKQEHMLTGGFRDIERIGDFEVFYEMTDAPSNREVMDISTIVDEGDSGKPVLRGYRITLCSEYLSGNYILETSTENAGNITSFQTKTIKVDEQDVTVGLYIPESSYLLEARLFDPDAPAPFQLIAHAKIPIIREIHMQMHMITRTATLVDRYTKKNRDARNKLEQGTSSTIKVGGESSDPWRIQFGQVYEDFSQLYRNTGGESVYFPKGRAHETFLEWMRAKINRASYTEIWLFDPYIDRDCLPGLLRMISESGIRIHIITDASAPHSGEQRLDDMKNACEEMKSLFTSSLEIAALKKKQPSFHDRYLFLVGDTYVPEVYMLSNSLDGMAKRHSSVLAKVNLPASKEVAEEYLERYRQAKESGTLQIILQSAPDKTSDRTPEKNRGKQNLLLFEEALSFMNKRLSTSGLPPLSYHDETGHLSLSDAAGAGAEESKSGSKRKAVRILCTNLREDWAKLSHLLYYMVGEDFSLLWEECRGQFKADQSEDFRNMIRDGILERQNPETDQPEGMLRVGSMANLDSLLKWANNNWDSSIYEPGEFYMTPVAHLSFRMLMQCDFQGILPIFEPGYEKDMTYRQMKRLQFLLRHLISELHYVPESGQQKITEQCLLCDSPEIRSIGMVWCQKNNRSELVSEFVDDVSQCRDFFCFSLIEWQATDLRRGYRANKKRNSRIDENEFKKNADDCIKKINGAKENLCHYMIQQTDKISNEKNRQILDKISYRSAQDTADLLAMLYQQNMDRDWILTCLISAIFKKADEILEKKDGYWTTADFQKSMVFIDLLDELFGQEEQKNLLIEISSRERKFLRTLHDVFLYHKNYRMWHSYMDTLIWLETLRRVLRKSWPDYEDLKGQDREGEAVKLIESYQSSLDRYSDAYKIFRIN